MFINLIRSSIFLTLPHTLIKSPATVFTRNMSSAASFYDLKAATPKGDLDFNTLKGKVVLIYNSASKCGYTSQLAGLQSLHEKYESQGLVVLGFPSGQFGGQEYNTPAEISNFCTKNYGVTFPMMSKSDVNGPNANAVFTYAKAKTGVASVGWNFEKFIVSRDGTVKAHYGSSKSPAQIAPEIEKLLAEEAKL